MAHVNHPTARPTARPALLAGRYRLAEEIAVGGTARVVAAVDERLGRRVAVKLVDVAAVEASDPGARQRFLREARTSAGFTHPHAVAVYDAGEDAGVLFLVMELVDGPSLAQVLPDGPLPVERAVRIARQVLAALDAAHAIGVAHRDVKPANVLITPAGDAKLADFGIAKRFDDLTDSITRTGFVVGTPRYLAPEQALGLPVSPATDVYAVGVLLYEMLTGTPPYDGATASAAALAHHVTPVPDVRDLRPDVPGTVAAAVTRALAKEPGERFPTAAAMATALQRGGTGTQVMPAVAVSPAAGRGRHWIPVVVVAAMLLVLVAGVLATSDDALAPIAPSDTAATTVAPATDAPTTTAVTSTVPPTVAPTVAPTAAAVAEIVPGFPATDDLSQFLRQLEADPSVVGPAGEELAGELEKVLADGGRKQADRAAELLDKVPEWADEGRLAPEVADALEPLLAPLADKPGRGGDDDD